ncbi:MAG: choice-of-anchor J domain-containing protein, partial [Lachnospiraceae bacterium]|nr:choice-of-anchor J domain-containing protein [Lachnospiraceae bacterium]
NNAAAGHINGTNSGAKSQLLSPWLDLSGFEAPCLNFWYVSQDWSGDIDELTIYYRKRGGEWIQLFHTAEAHEVWTNLQINLPAEVKNSSIQFSFEATDRYGRGVGLDDVQVIASRELLNESFEDGIPNSWTSQVSSTQPDYYWKVGRGDGSDIFLAHSGEFNALITHKKKDAEADLITPDLNLLGKKNVVLDFWYLNREYSGDIDKLTICYRHEGDATDTKILEISSAHDRWTHQAILLPQGALSDGTQIIFRATDKYGHGIALDDVKVYHIDENAVFSVTYDANGATGVMTDINEYEVLSYAVAKENAYKAPAGKDFYGWNTEPDGSGTAYRPGDQILMMENVTLYAQWEDRPISLDASFDSLPYGWTTTSTNEAFRWVNSGGFHTTDSSMGDGEAWLISPMVNLSRCKNALLWLDYGNAYNITGTTDLFLYYRIAGGEWHEIPFEPGNTESGFIQVRLLMPQGALTDELQIGIKSVSCENHVNAVREVILQGTDDDYHDIEINIISGFGSVTLSQNFGAQGDFVNVYVSSVIALETITVLAGNEEIYLADEGNGLFVFEMPNCDVTVEAVFANYDTVFYEDFEDDGQLPDGWVFVDADGDTFNWEIVSPEQEDRLHSGAYLLSSESYSNEHSLALTPDNWAITPGIMIPENASLSFWIRGMDPDWVSEKMGVYVGLEPTIGAMVPLQESIIATDIYENYCYSLDDYVGKTVYFGFRHYGVTDMFRLCLEDVGVFAYQQSVKTPAVMRYVKAAFDGKIGLAFFMELPEWLVNDEKAYVTFTQCGETKRKLLSEFVAAGENADGYYRIATYMPAAYYRDNVTVRLYDSLGRRVNIKGASTGNDLTGTGVVYTLQRYINNIKNSSDAKTKNLAVAMEDYCTAAQIYFDHNLTGETLTLSSAVGNVKQSQLESYKAVRSGNLPSKVLGVSLRASFESDNALKLGLNFENNKK